MGGSSHRSGTGGGGGGEGGGGRHISPCPSQSPSIPMSVLMSILVCVPAMCHAVACIACWTALLMRPSPPCVIISQGDK